MIDSFNEGLIIGLASAGLHQIKKVYDVNYKIEEHFKDFIILSKCISIKDVYIKKTYIEVKKGGGGVEGGKAYYVDLNSKYTIKDIVKVVGDVEGGKDYYVDLNSKYTIKDIVKVVGDIGGKDYDIDISLSKRFNKYTECFVDVFKSFSIVLEDKYKLRVILDLLSDKGVLNKLSISERYRLRDKLDVIKCSYYDLSKSVSYLLSDEISKQISSDYDIDLIHQYILKDISILECVIAEMDSVADCKYALSSDVSMQISRGYEKVLSIKYNLKEDIVIECKRESDGGGEGDLGDGNLIDILNMSDSISIKSRGRVYVNIDDGLGVIADGLGVIASGVLNLSIVDNLGVIDDAVKVTQKSKHNVNISDALVDISEEVILSNKGV